VEFLARLARQLGRWPIAFACVVVLSAAVLLPGLGDFGLWEPQERQFSDRQAPRRIGTVAELDAMVKPAVASERAPKPAPAPGPEPSPALPAADPSCLHAPPHDAVARSLVVRAARWGRDLDDSDAGRRLPFALLGLLTVLATAGIAMRLAGSRAGALTALVLLAMPLLVFQSRQLTSEIGTAAGGALILYGLVALGRTRGLVVGLADAIVAVAAIVAGVVVGFASGGALLGLVVPIGAFAAAGALGVPGFVTLWRAVARAAFALVRKLRPRAAIGRGAVAIAAAETPVVEQIKAVVATLALAGVVGALAYQLYDLVRVEDLPPGNNSPLRQVFGHAIVPSKCWSSTFGAILRSEDDLRFIYDSTFEQIAYGTFPWGVLAPIAIAALVMGKDRGRRQLGALALAWGGGAWIATEVFQRRVGFTLYGGFPALALALGTWLDGVFAPRPIGANGAEPDEGRSRASRLLVASFAVLAVLVLGKDMFSFAERLPSLLVGADGVTYPKMARLALLPPKLWVLVLGAIVAVAFALALTFHDGIARARRIASGALAAMLVATALVAAFWAFAWQPVLGEALSSKSMFDTLHDLAQPGDSLVMMGDLGDAPHDYAPDMRPEPAASREQIVVALGRPNRVFAIAPQSELCQLHHDLAHKAYFVLDDRNLRSLLVSNRVDGASDKNPLRLTILHDEPKHIPYRPKGKVVWESSIQLLGWDIPRSVSRGSKFEVKTYYKILQPVGGSWTVLFHFDGPLRFNGDHPPIDGRCTTAQWSAGDYIVDTHTVVAGGGAFPEGQYEVWTGFFTGSAPNWRNMKLSEAPGDIRDTTDRVKITTINLD
jgi:hypothetical protein